MNWNNFYKDFKEVEPSSFARSLNLGGRIIADLGCGNGRDSYFFGKNNLVFGVDSAVKNEDTDSVKFFKQDVSKFIDETIGIDTVYCRFFFHSIPEELEDKILNFSKGKDLYIEARAEGDEPTLYKDHKRRYIKPDKLLKKIIDMGFKSVNLTYGRSLAQYMSEDPLVVRIIAKWNSQ